MNRTIRHRLLATALALTLAGCGGDPLPFLRAPKSTPPQPTSTGSARPQPSSHESVATRADRYLADDDPQSALDLVAPLVRDGRADARLLVRYERAMMILMDRANDLLRQHHSLEAGALYRSLADHYADGLLPVSLGEIRFRIERCADKLMENGMASYRAGRLEEAINIWSRIRTFHPTYRASQQAIDTTRIQLKNLDSIKENPG